MLKRLKREHRNSMAAGAEGTRNAARRDGWIMTACVLALMLSAAAMHVVAEEAGAADAPKVIAVKFHADWCGYCKAMGPAFEELQAKFDTQPVLFVTLDQTRDFNRKQSEYMAQSLGLGRVWAEHAGKTGFVLLIDGSTREVIGKVTHEQNLKQMGAALVEAVGKASGSKAVEAEKPEASKATKPEGSR